MVKGAMALQGAAAAAQGGSPVTARRPAGPGPKSLPPQMAHVSERALIAAPAIGSDWPVADHGHPVHHAAAAVIVVDRVMHGAAIVPEGEGAGYPSIAAGELRPRGMAEEMLQQRPALFPGPILEVLG